MFVVLAFDMHVQRWMHIVPYNVDIIALPCGVKNVHTSLIEHTANL